MKGLFWFSLAVIAYTYIGYPVAIGVLARFFPKPWQQVPWDLAEPPVSIIMAVHNGAPMLTRQLDHLMGLDPHLVKEVLVVSDGSNDGTDDILNAARHHRLRVFCLSEQGGKAAALNRAISEATGEILLFIDIRPRVEDGAIASLLSNFVDASVGCVTGELVLGVDGHDATASAVSGLYWRYEQWIRTCESAFDSPVGVYGGFYAARRALVVHAPPGLILDDMFQPLSIIRQGYRSVLDRRAVVVDRWPAKAAGEFSRKVRTLAGNFQLVALAPWVLSRQNRLWVQLVSHKLLRLMVPYCFLGLFASSLILGLASAGYGSFALLQLVFWLTSAIAIKWPIPVLRRIAAPASALLMLNAAAVMGLYTFLFTQGPLWKIWSPTTMGETSVG